MPASLPLDAARLGSAPTEPITPLAPGASLIEIDPMPATSGDAAPRPWRRRARRTLTVLVAGAMLAGVFAAGAGSDRAGLLPGSPAPTTAAPSDPNLALIDQAWNLLHEKYVGAATLDSKNMAYQAIDGMTNAVGDEGHTTFLTPAELATSQASLSGSYAGIGAEMDTTGDQPIVVGVFRDSPAYVAGLRSGDVVTAVDGKPTKGTPLDSVIASVRGQAGTSVTLTITRSGSSKPLTLRIVRAEVTVPAVEWAMVPGTQVADIRIEQFSNGAADAFKKALGEALARQASGIILDLRGDPGGYVNEAVGVASQFLTSGNVYISRDATGKETPTPVSPGGIAPTIPLVVLVDGGTASSAEIVTGALQDAGRAKVIGVRTFGTGTVLGRFDLADGSALRIGTVEWLTPTGRQIWHQGITPDVVVPLSADVQRVAPQDLQGLGASGIAKTPDLQFRAALEALKAAGG